MTVLVQLFSLRYNILITEFIIDDRHFRQRYIEYPINRRSCTIGTEKILVLQRTKCSGNTPSCIQVISSTFNMSTKFNQLFFFSPVTERLHWFYSAKFRNRANSDVNHRLFIPQASPVSNFKKTLLLTN